MLCGQTHTFYSCNLVFYYSYTKYVKNSDSYQFADDDNIRTEAFVDSKQL